MLTCIKCPAARFPEPSEQCYKWGGLICTIDDANVEKYGECRFGWDEGKVASGCRDGKSAAQPG